MKGNDILSLGYFLFPLKWTRFYEFSLLGRVIFTEISIFVLLSERLPSLGEATFFLVQRAIQPPRLSFWRSAGALVDTTLMIIHIINHHFHSTTL